MEKDAINKLEFNVHDGGLVIIAKDNAEVSAVQNNITSVEVQKTVKSRTPEYLKKWNDNMFLNNFDKRDENAGVNVKLSDVYSDEQLPHYIWGNNKNTRNDLKDLLKEYIYPHNDNKMLLILGQPGIGKSTLITWITANFTNKIDDILVYQFASNLKNVIWQNLGNDIKRSLLEELNILTDDLEGKILILDGFDEISVGNDRVEILNQMYWKFIKEGSLNNFSLIITCRENYIHGLTRINCSYITLQSWNEDQIRGFCKTFQEKTKHDISEYTIANILNNKEILGIPLILYMVLALNISIEKDGSIVDIYDRIFSLKDGGIYDRCIANKNFAERHRIGKIKTQIHQISREIAFWMFENNPDEAFIPQEEYEKICSNIMEEQAQENNELIQDFKIGSYFKLVKHCEGVETEELYFVHRSIYEYFVAETIFSFIRKAINESKKSLAGGFGRLLKGNVLSKEILQVLKNKIKKSRLNTAFDIVNIAFNSMLEDGMTYYTYEHYKNVIDCELRVLANMLEVMHLWEKDCYKFSQKVDYYIKLCPIEYKLNLSRIDLIRAYLSGANLSGANLSGANLSEADLSVAYLIGADLSEADLSVAYLIGADLNKANLFGANLNEANLSEANLSEANLNEANLSGANLSGANLFGANLNEANLNEANLSGAIFNEEQIVALERNGYNLQGTRVYIEEIGKIIDYEEYCKRKH